MHYIVTPARPQNVVFECGRHKEHGTYKEFTKALPDIVTEDPPAAGPRDGITERNTALGEYVNRTLSAVQVNPPSTDTSSAMEPPTEAEAGERQTTAVDDTNMADTLKNY